MLNYISRKDFFIYFMFLIFLPIYITADNMPDSPAGGGVLDLRGLEKSYYYAEDIDDCFDNETFRNGMTIEFWYCPARITEPGEWWNLVAKPNSRGYIYNVFMEHYLRGNDEWMRLCRDGGCRGFWDVNQGKKYKPEWHHVILQIRGVDDGFCGKGFEGVMYLDGILSSRFSSSSSFYVFDSKYPFYVGGLPEDFQMALHIHEEYKAYNVSTFDGQIDEMRISKIERYPVEDIGERINIKDHFKSDDDTLALWHFDGGKGNAIYKDSSGNGHTLFAGGALGINPEKSVKGLWGAIKKELLSP